MIALVLGAPAAAQAAIANVDAMTGLATYSAGGNEPNELTVSAEPGVLVFRDPGAPIIIPLGSCAPDPADPAAVRCPVSGLIDLLIDTHELVDGVRIDESVYATFALGFVRVDGGDGGDTLVTGSGREFLFGRDGNDTIDSGAGNDQVDGHGGDDTIVGGAGDDVLFGFDGVDTLDGGLGNDTLDGDADLDTLRGGEGEDRIDEGPEAERGPDVISGGAGTDTLDYSARTSPLAVSLDGQANDGAIGEGDNAAGDLEVILGGSDSDTLIGGPNGDRLDGGPGDDLIEGAGGNDTILGGLDSGSDGLSGGGGNDTVRGGAGDDSLAGGAGTDDLGAGGGSDALAGDGDDDVLAGGPGLDALNGGDGNDTLRGADIVLVGADAADEIVGGPGNDTVLGGPGNDSLDGGLGADSLRGEAGRDTVTYQDRATPVTVTLDDLPNDGEAGEGDNVASDVEAVVGGTVGDTLSGNPDSNELSAGSGPDYVDPAAGSDTIAGGTARDTLRSRDGVRDRVSCGGGRDFAIVDRADVVRDCEHVDNGTRRRPAVRRDAIVTPTRGQLALQLPGTGRFFPMQERLVVPLGATVDARHGTARLATAAKQRTRIQRASFTGGQFRMRQTRGKRPITVLRLTGGNLGRCVRATGSRPGAAYAAQAPGRRLWGRFGGKRGRYRTRGRHSSGTVRGTVWLTEDRCDGTLTRVVSGTVAVRDFGLRRTVLVRAGESYLARSR